MLETVNSIYTDAIRNGEGSEAAKAKLIAAARSKGAELGRFKLGSTVILLLGRDAVQWNGDLAAGRSDRSPSRAAVCPRSVLQQRWCTGSRRSTPAHQAPS